MIKYLTVAAVLKLFSATPQMRYLYRRFGNIYETRRRLGEGLPEVYLERLRFLLDAVKKHDMIHPGDRLLEVGTGWVHWEATGIRLFYDVRITLFDIWDNRLLIPFKLYFRRLGELMDTVTEILPSQRDEVRRMLEKITSVASFEELYELLGFEYVIEPKGTLHRFRDGSFDLIYSNDVMEHIKADILPGYIRDFARLLKPGGYSVHSIDPCDHLYYFDRKMPVKNYLKYSDKSWKRYFENDVQYFNRVQRSQWLDLFQQAGLELVWEEAEYDEIGLTPHNDYRDLDKQDINCTSLKVIHRKPL